MSAILSDFGGQLVRTSRRVLAWLPLVGAVALSWLPLAAVLLTNGRTS